MLNIRIVTRFIVFGTVAAVGLLAQQLESQPGSSSSEKGATRASVDPKLHADVAKLLQLDGTRERMERALPELVEQAKAMMVKVCGDCGPAVSEEWGKRVLARTNIDDYVSVYVKAYEKYFTDNDVLELLMLIEQKYQQPRPTLSPKLKEKLESVLPSFQSEVMGASTQIGAKLGSEIEIEIRKEHPDYFVKLPTK
jgi:hypothetical protein